MLSSRWRQVSDIFLAIVDLPHEARNSRLEALCGEDDDLRSEVARLLERDDATQSATTPVLRGPFRVEVETQHPFAPMLRSGHRVGAYTLIRQIGAGGMGVVWLAERKDPDKTVAIKFANQAFETRSGQRQFAHERQLLAGLEHENIARMYDSGSDNGRPYFAMEFVEGQPLDEYCDRENLTTHDRLKLFQSVCAGVRYLHQRFVIHRDLKPSNIIVTKEGVPKLLDFGAAKPLDGHSCLSPRGNTTGLQVMSTQYACPEQVRGEPMTVQSDVYTLGVVLYELLTGHLPYRLVSRSAAEIERVVCEDGSARPSDMVARTIELEESTGTLNPESVSRSRGVSVERLRRQLAGDLDNIVLKAMSKEVGRRYISVDQFSEDIQRHLDNLPVLARPDSARYRIGKFIRRNRAAVAAGVAFVVLLVGTTLTTTAMYLDAREQTRIADALAGELEQVIDFQASQLGAIDPERMGSDLREGVLRHARASMEEPGLQPDMMTAKVGAVDHALSLNYTSLAVDALRENILDTSLATINKNFADQPLVQARLLQALATASWRLGLLEMAVEAQERALGIRREKLDADHPLTLESINKTGFLYIAQWRLKDAMPLYHEALEGRRRVLGNAHPETLESINNMGYLLTMEGEFAAAQTLYDESLEGRRRVLGNDHPITLASITNMGDLLQSLGRFTEAEPFYREATEGHRRVLGDSHPDTLNAISNMGFLYHAQGKWMEAEALFREALEGRRRVLGDLNPGTLRSINNMGAIFKAQGKLSMAEPLYREALAGRRRVLGNDHRETLTSINNVGLLFKSQGKLSEAEPLYREALAGRRRILGNDHPDTLGSINNMGALLLQQGNFDEAEPLYREALAGRRRTLGDDHPDTLGSINNMGFLLAKLGKLSKADTLYREALEGRRRVLGNEHPHTLGTINNVGDLLRKMGALSEAEIFYREALAGRQRVLGDTHPKTQSSRVGLAQTLIGLDDFPEAEGLLLDVAERSKRSDVYWNQAAEALSELYEAWHVAEPAKGFCERADHWRQERSVTAD